MAEAEANSQTVIRILEQVHSKTKDHPYKCG